jgi:hypothetical protein
MASSVVELTAVLANLVLFVVLWRVLCLNKSGFEGRGVVVDRSVFICERARGSRLTVIRTRCSGRRGGVPFPHAPIVLE